MYYIIHISLQPKEFQMFDNNVINGSVVADISRMLGPVLDQPTQSSSIIHVAEDHLFVWNDKYGLFQDLFQVPLPSATQDSKNYPMMKKMRTLAFNLFEDITMFSGAEMRGGGWGKEGNSPT